MPCRAWELDVYIHMCSYVHILELVYLFMHGVGPELEVVSRACCSGHPNGG